VIAKHQGDHMAVGIEGLIRWDVRPEMEVVVQPRTIGWHQLQKKALQIAQQSRFVLIHHQSRGGVLAGRHQQAIPQLGLLHQLLQLSCDVVAAEGGGAGQLQPLGEHNTHLSSPRVRIFATVGSNGA
jgi:hypothetical protein